MSIERIGRRAALQRLAIAGAGATAAAAGSGRTARAINRNAADLSVTVLLDEPIGTIRPEIYSQFAEHIGGVIYDGIWVGPESKIPNIDGIRRTLIEHVASARAGRRALARAVASPTSTTGATASAAPTGAPAASAAGAKRRKPTSSAPMNSCDFADFAASSRISPPTSARARRKSSRSGSSTATPRPDRQPLPTTAPKNGQREPFGVRYWGVGNESWGCGGKFIPEDYCREYRRFTEWVPGYGVPLYLIAAGPNGNNTEWTRRFFAGGPTAHAPDPGLGAPLLLRHDRPCPQVHHRPVVRTAPQGQPDGNPDQGPVGRTGRI